LKQSAKSNGKNSPARPLAVNAVEPERVKNVLNPSFRFFIIPLGTVCTLASLSSQNVAHRGAAVAAAHQQVTDCSKTNPTEVCVIR